MMTSTSNARLPSIRSRLSTALAAWSLLWGLAVGAAVWLAAAHEVDELLDDALQSSAELLAMLADAAPRASTSSAVVPSGNGSAVERFAWQVTGPDGALLLRSRRAPAQLWRATPSTGFSETDEWRLYGLSMGAEGRVLVVAQTKAERRSARADVGLRAVLAALAVGLVGHAWLRSRIKRELEPLQALSRRLEAWDVDAPDALAPGVLGAAERRELQPVHRALGSVTQRLATRVANEQAFSAHAAHALRTPLAGIDAQLAVTLRDVPAPWRERIQRARDAAARLQAVVGALLGLFRSGAQSAPTEVDMNELVQRLPAPRLHVAVAAGLRVRADADLLAAGLLNLIDNAQRHGARHVWIEAVGAEGPAPGRSEAGPAPSGGSERSERGGSGGPARGRSEAGPAPSGGSERSERGGSGGPAPGRSEAGPAPLGGSERSERGGSGFRVRDDGPGIAAERRAALQAALDAQRYEGTTGLGLMLADRVARAHGGRLRLPVTSEGFAVEFVLPPAETGSRESRRQHGE